jgi:hypothetical protein
MTGLRNRTTHGATGDPSYGRADARRPALDQSRHGTAGVAVGDDDGDGDGEGDGDGDGEGDGDGDGDVDVDGDAVAAGFGVGVGVVPCPELDTVQNSLAGALPLTPSVL